MPRKYVLQSGGELTSTVLSLFTGAGGLDLGLEAAGFDVLLCVENDADCHETVKRNKAWKLADPPDITEISPRNLRLQAGLARRELDLLAGGPPCQPFSKSRYWVNGDTPRFDDPRANTLQRYIDVVDEFLPRVLLLENVRGLSYSGKDEGLVFLRSALAAVNTRRRTAYDPVVMHLNAAHYGVPQLRERTFIVASRDGARFTPPPITHHQQPSQQNTSRLCNAWDAIGHLDAKSSDDVGLTGKWADLIPSIPEGMNYLFHTKRGGGLPLFGWRTRYWSFLLKLAKSKPAWTIQATPGPATGPFHWHNRRLTTRELARLQTFPESYIFSGDSRSTHRQIGNAVPPALAEVLGLAIHRQLLNTALDRQPRLGIALRDDCSKPKRPAAVPRKYLVLAGEHADHPGPARGPRAAARGATASDADS